MAKQVTVGEFTLETSGDQIVVRDATGGIVETVDIDDLNGDLMLPSGQWVDVAALMAGPNIDDFQTAAGGQPGAEGPAAVSPNGGPANFSAFRSDSSDYSARGSAGALGNTALDYSTPGGTSAQRFYQTSEQQQPIVVTWADHEPWRIEENQRGAVFGKVVAGNPADYTFEVSDARFEVVDGVLQVRNGYTFDFEDEPGIELQITATSRTGDVQTLTTHIDVTDVNEAQTALTIDNAAVDENTAGAVIGTLTVTDPDAKDQQSFAVSDSRFEVVDGQLKLKEGIALDHEGEGTVSVIVTATDEGGHEISKTFNVQIGDVNEAPTDIDLSGSTLVENVAGAVVGALSAIDPDSGDSHTFQVSDARFEVVNGELKLKDGVTLDFEAEPTLNVVVTATDAGGKSVQETFTLSVGDANEAQTAIAFSGAAKVAENAAGAVVGTITVTDPDAGDVQSFKVSDDRFEVVDGQLKLKDGVALNFEAETSVQVTVTATDKGGHEVSKTVSVGVTDVNEAQTSMTLSKSSVAENSKGAVIGTITVADPDAGDKQSFTISDSRFQIVNGQLKLKSGVSIDYETEPSVDVTVSATDKGGNKISQTFEIDVTNVNEKQTSISLTGNTVAENSKGAIIGSVSVSDPDAGDVQSYKVSDNRFEVVDGQLKLKDGVSLSYESAATVNVKVTATDTGNNSISKTFAINVGDVNEAQTNMTLTGNKVSENAAGAVVGTLKVTDPDKGDAQSYTVSDNRFEVVGDQLKLKDGVSLDYEVASKVSVDVTATDMAGHQITKTYAVNVGNVWEAQTDMTLSASNVKENAAGAIIGTLKVADPDKSDTQTYKVSDSRFEVVSGKLKLKAGVSLDYEADSTVEIDVTATDKGGNQITKSYTINVSDVNEAQTAITLDNMSVAENSTGPVVVGTLSVADQDAGDTQTFKVSDSRFEVVNGELRVKAGVSFDHEATPSVDVTVTATDKGKHSLSQTFTISIADVNEAQTGMTLSSKQVAENAPGAVIGIVAVTDPDAGDVQSFQVSDSRFEVVNGELKLKDGISLDHEAEGSVTVTVKATDTAGHEIAQDFKITVGDQNEAQTGMTLSGSSVSENAAGAVIGALAVSDPDAGDSQSFQVSDNRFEVVNGQLKLKDGVSLDYEAGATVDVTVTATDGGSNQYSKTFTISIADANEAQTAMTPTGAMRVSENAAGAVAGGIIVSDPDAGDKQTFTVSDNRFEVDNNTLKLKDGVSLDHEATPSVNVTVTATDMGGNQISKTITVGVDDVNEQQTSISFVASSIAENTTTTTSKVAVAGTILVTDPDAGDTQTYTVSDNRFQVVNNQLVLKPGASLDYETEPTVKVTITATDKGGNTISTAATVNVTNVNEAQTGMTISASKVAENASGATIGTLTTTDPDAGDTQTYTVSDSRFEVVNNQLKLKSGQSLDYEAGATINLTVTATDKGQNQYTKAFTVQVTDANEIAPVVVAKDGSSAVHVYDTVTTYTPTASSTVGAYLYSNDSAKVAAPAASELTAIDGANMTLKMDTEVQVTFQKEAAGNKNMVGTYQYDDAGKIIAGSVKFVWLDASATNEGVLGSAMTKDFLGYSQANTVSLGTMDAGTHVGFFTISNGANDSANRSLLTTAVAGTTSQTAAMDAIASQLSIKIDANGNGQVYVGNTQMNGAVFFTHDKSLNTDFNGTSDIVHMTSGVSSNMPSQLMIGVEDLAGGGDKDFNDVVFSVNLGSYDTNKTVSNAVQPSVDFSDADSATLTQATIQTSGFQSGDVLTIPTSGLFNVSVTHTTAEYTITITGKTGSETVDQYETFVNSISFSTTSKVEGDRHIDYSVTDNGGLKSNVDTADISVDADYHVSTSELGNGKTKFSDGADDLYINTASFGQVDMGDGYDTVHLAQQGRNFDHNDAVKLSGVEQLDTTGYGANKVSLSITDVLNMTDDDNQLTVIGDKGDVVTLESSGKGKWEVTGQDAEFTTYHYTDSSHEAIVQISNQLTAQVA